MVGELPPIARPRSAHPRVLLYDNREIIPDGFNPRAHDLRDLMDSIEGMVPLRQAQEAGEGGEAFDLALITQFGHPRSVAVGWETGFDRQRLRAVPKRVLMVHDAHEKSFKGGHEAMRNFISRWAHYVILVYRSEAGARLLEGCPVRKVYELPHHINMDIFRDYGLEKRRDVLLYGRTRPEHYPFRHRLAQLLPRSGLKVEILPHPTQVTGEEGVVGEALARRINESWLTIATRTRHDIFLAKYLEIAASGGVVAGDMPTRAQEIWGSNYVNLDMGMSDAEIIKTLQDALRDREALKRMAAAMYEPIRKAYTYDLYVSRLRAILDDIHQDGN